jgi:hypothetical protein
MYHQFYNPVKLRKPEKSNLGSATEIPITVCNNSLLFLNTNSNIHSHKNQFSELYMHFLLLNTIRTTQTKQNIAMPDKRKKKPEEKGP